MQIDGVVEDFFVFHLGHIVVQIEDQAARFADDVHAENDHGDNDFSGSLLSLGAATFERRCKNLCFDDRPSDSESGRYAIVTQIHKKGKQMTLARGKRLSKSRTKWIQQGIKLCFLYFIFYNLKLKLFV